MLGAVIIDAVVFGMIDVGVVERIGADHIHGNVDTALEAQLAEDDAAGRVVAVDGTWDSRHPPIDGGAPR